MSPGGKAYRILMIAPIVPRPRDSGGLMRSFQNLRALAEVGDITLVSFGRSSNGADLSEVSKFCSRVELLTHQQVPPLHYPPRLGPLYKLRAGLGSPLPTMFGVYQDPNVGALFRRLDPEGFDLVWQEQAATVAADRWFRASSSVVDLYDVNHAKMARELRVAGFYPTKPLDRLEQLKWRLYERHVLRRYARVVVCSVVDQRRLELPQTRVVPNCVDVPAPTSDDETPGELIYLGSMGYQPNVDAVVYFCEQILPRIARVRPDVTLSIVGTQPRPAVRRLHDGHRVKVVGPVENVTPFLRRAQAMVVPLRVAGGTRIKILEALALGRSVVTTSVGAEGLEVTDGEHVLVADEPEVFARRCVEVLEDRALRDRLGRRGRELVMNRFSYLVVREEVRRVVEEVIEEKQRRTVSARRERVNEKFASSRGSGPA